MPKQKKKKSGIQETLNLLMCANSNTKKKRYKKIMILTKKILGAMCHVSDITCRMSPVTYNMPLTPTVTTMDPPPANCPTMHSRMMLLILSHQQLFVKAQKCTFLFCAAILNHFRAKIKNSETIVSSSLFHKICFKLIFFNFDLNQPKDQFSENTSKSIIQWLRSVCCFWHRYYYNKFSNSHKFCYVL